MLISKKKKAKGRPEPDHIRAGTKREIGEAGATLGPS